MCVNQFTVYTCTRAEAESLKAVVTTTDHWSQVCLLLLFYYPISILICHLLSDYLTPQLFLKLHLSFYWYLRHLDKQQNATLFKLWHLGNSVLGSRLHVFNFLHYGWWVHQPYACMLTLKASFIYTPHWISRRSDRGLRSWDSLFLIHKFLFLSRFLPKIMVNILWCKFPGFSRLQTSSFVVTECFCAGRHVETKCVWGCERGRNGRL